MEKNCVSLETAKKLKAAGFPQKAANWWNPYRREEPGNSDGWVVAYNLYPYEGNNISKSVAWEPWTPYSAPTAQELADELPRISLASNGEEFWSAWYQDGDGVSEVTDDIGADGPSMAEALAALALKLAESGDIKWSR